MIDLSSVTTIASGSWLFTNCRAAKNIKLPANAAVRNAYGIFKDCISLERVWLDGGDLPVVGTVDLGSAASLQLDADAFENAYLINTIVLADNTSFTSDEWLTTALQNTGKDHPYSQDITVNLVCKKGSAAEEALDAQSRTKAVYKLKIGVNGTILSDSGDIEVDISGWH